eukprot:2397898-Rhodomonas_salina.1
MIKGASTPPLSFGSRRSGKTPEEHQPRSPTLDPGVFLLQCCGSEHGNACLTSTRFCATLSCNRRKGNCCFGYRVCCGRPWQARVLYPQAHFRGTHKLVSAN